MTVIWVTQSRPWRIEFNPYRTAQEGVIDRVDKSVNS
jgi:hypothetical protein